MSECVVRMEMPQNCWCCPSGHPDWIYNDDGAEQMVCFCNICNTEEDDMWISETEIARPSWCPIICALPEGHGRLVDADALLRDIEQYHVSDGQFQHWLELQPTIVPADTAERSET